MKTSTQELNEYMKKHIMDCVYDYDENPFDSFEEAKQHLKSEFDRVANYPLNITRIPNEQDRFSDYLMGLPFHFEFEDEAITNFLNGLDIDPVNPMEYYHNLIFKQIQS